jgi:hypothetical protein
MNRKELQAAFESTIKTATGHNVEIVVSHSIQRGGFISVCGTIAALDAARALIEQAGNATFTDRDIDPDDVEQVDFYSLAAA